MSHELQATANSPIAFSLATPPASIVRPTKSIDIVRVESELLAIDELMSDLTADFVSDAK